MRPHPLRRRRRPLPRPCGRAGGEGRAPGRRVRGCRAPAHAAESLRWRTRRPRARRVTAPRATVLSILSGHHRPLHPLRQSPWFSSSSSSLGAPDPAHPLPAQAALPPPVAELERVRRVGSGAGGTVWMVRRRRVRRYPLQRQPPRVRSLVNCMQGCSSADTRSSLFNDSYPQEINWKLDGRGGVNTPRKCKWIYGHSPPTSTTSTSPPPSAASSTTFRDEFSSVTCQVASMEQDHEMNTHSGEL